jgi:hypothetical protein
METLVFRVSAKWLGGWGWVADFAYRWDAERFIADRHTGNEYKVESISEREAQHGRKGASEVPAMRY